MTNAVIVLSFDMGLRNLAYCVVEATGTPGAASLQHEKIHAWQVMDIVGSNAKKITIEKATNLMVEKCSSMLANMKPCPTVVAIEQQPVGFHQRSNIKMKVLSHVMQTLCKIHFPHASIHFISPKRKLRDLPKTVEKQNKKRYAYHKKITIAETNRRLTDSSWKTWFSGLEKQDDASDAYLQAVNFAHDTILPPPKKKRKRTLKSLDKKK
jgi:hypothetical protein